MKTIKTTQQLTLIKVGASGNDNVYLNVDTNGALEISTTTGSDGGLTVKGATSEVNLEGNLTVTGTTAIPTLGSDLDVNGFDIISSSNGDIELLPDGTGKILLTGTTKMGGDIDVNGNLITTTVTNGNVGITPNGTGEINLNGPVNLGGDLDIGSYNIISTAGADIELDPDGVGKILLSATTQLGGDLDVVSHNIISSSNNDIEIDPDGTGQILLTAVTKLGGNLDVNGNLITTSVTNGNITITPNGSGLVTLGGDMDVDGNDITTTVTNGNVVINSNGTGDVLIDGTSWGDVVQSTFGGSFINLADAAHTLSADEAKSNRILLMGSKSGDTYYAKSVSINLAGSGYTAGDILTVVGGTSTTVAKIKVDTVGGTGDITGILIETDVAGDEGDYTVTPANPVSVTGGTGTLATFDINWDYRGTELIIDVADDPVNFTMYNLYQNGYVVIRSSNQLYREGRRLHLLQNKEYILNTSFLPSDDVYELGHESGSINDRVSVDIMVDSDYNINYDTAKNYFIELTDNGTVLTTARSVEITPSPFDPSQPALSFVKNSTAQTLTYKQVGGTGVPVLANQTRAIYFDGNDYVKFPIYVEDDSTPKLSGDLDVNGNDIISTITNGDIVITPNGSGNIVLDGVDWPNSAGTADYVLKTNGSNAASWTLLNLDYLDDVVISGASEGDSLIHNGTNWIETTYSKFYELTATTTDATATVIKAVPIASNTAATFIINGHGFEAATGVTYAVHLFGCIKNYAGTTSIVGSVDSTHVHNPGGTTWSITAVANDTNDTLDITITGENAKTISWKVKADLIQG